MNRSESTGLYALRAESFRDQIRPFEIVNPLQAVNFACSNGLYPSRP